MANTVTDNYINNLTPWDEIEYDWEIHIIIRTDQYKCYINDDWNIVGVDWAGIAETYELMQLENKIED